MISSPEKVLSKMRHKTHSILIIAGLTALTGAAALLCISLGSVTIPFRDTLAVLFGKSGVAENTRRILLSYRIPRVLCVMLSGAALSVSGCAMQGLLRNPLADGSTLGVSSGAALGAALSIALGIRFPRLPFSATMVMAAGFAFLTLLIVLTLAYRLDRSLSTQTIILLGIIFSMFISSILTLVVTVFSQHLKQITFWTMGSLSGSSMKNAAVLGISLLIGAAVLLRHAPELNAFALGEDNARSIGVPVTRTRLVILITVSILVGICVSIGGQVAFVGLVTPHMLRLLLGPNHRTLLPSSLFGGAVFLMLCDLAARVLFRPVELPVGAVTSIIGAALFIYLFYETGRRRS